MISLESRYQYFKKQEFETESNTLTDSEKDKIKESVLANISAVQADVAYENACENTKSDKLLTRMKAISECNEKFYEYSSSKEEYQARKSAKEAKLNELEKRKENGENVAKDIKLIKREMLRKKIYTTFRATSTNPLIK